MLLKKKFLRIIKEINEVIELPPIKQVFIPSISKEEYVHTKMANFGVIQLSEGSIGFFYLNLSEKTYNTFLSQDFSEFSEMSSFEASKEYLSNDLTRKSIGLGTINAISQYFFKESKYKFNYTLSPLGLLDVRSTDKVGMVGYFYSLLDLIANTGAELVVIEKKEKFLQKNPKFIVSLDPSKLKDCNKVLCTSTTLLNDTLEEILKHSKNAKKFSIIGPTAGFIPDPVFELGVDIIGGSVVTDAFLFIDLFKKRENWKPAIKKYCLTKNKYDGFHSLLRNITHN